MLSFDLISDGLAIFSRSQIHVSPENLMLMLKDFFGFIEFGDCLSASGRVRSRNVFECQYVKSKVY